MPCYVNIRRTIEPVALFGRPNVFNRTELTLLLSRFDLVILFCTVIRSYFEEKKDSFVEHHSNIKCVERDSF